MPDLLEDCDDEGYEQGGSKGSTRADSGQEGKAQGAFLEIFAGAGRLTWAVQREGFETLKPGDACDATYTRRLEFDLTNPEDFKRIAKLIKGGKIRWLHLAPPCSTFSVARRGGLRTRQRPAGIAARTYMNWKIKVVNLLADATARLVRLQIRAN